jgi:uncharacterized membrane protein YadS
VATAVKMARVALLVPVVLALSALGRRGGRVSLLWELVAFAAAAAAAATGRVPAALLDGADLVADALLGVAMAAIGAGLDLGHLRRAAPRALLAGALGFALQVGAVTAWLLLSASAAP